jgi:hypothetical protein
MRLDSEELKRLYQQQTARAARSRDDCLTAEVIMSAATGEFSHAERNKVADHLIACSDCAQEYRLARSLESTAKQQPPSRLG